jgi:hypothetical protein
MLCQELEEGGHGVALRAPDALLPEVGREVAMELKYTKCPNDKQPFEVEVP